MSYIYADLDDIVFENKDKDYGAYEMRRKYTRYLGRAAMIAILLFLCGTSVPKIVSWFVAPPKFVEDEMIEVIPVNLDTPPPTIEEEKPLPPPPEIEQPKIETIKFVVPVPDKDVSEDSTMKKMDDLDDMQIDDKDQKGDPDAKINWDDLDNDNKAGDLPPDEPELGPNDWVDLQEEPKPVNMDAFKALVGYPEMAKQADITGKVIMRVQVDKFGNYVKHVVLKDPHTILTNAVASKLSQLKFTPGIQAGKPVKVWVTIPVDFQLNK
jgi:periplasmic protein TonB